MWGIFGGVTSLLTLILPKVMNKWLFPLGDNEKTVAMVQNLAVVMEQKKLRGNPRVMMPKTSDNLK